MAVIMVGATLAVTACSGDDSEPDGRTPASAASSPGKSSAAPESFERACTVDVEITGAVQASWEGKGRSSNEAGPTMYTFTKGKDRITVYASKGDVPTNANVTVDGATYTTTDPESGLDVAGNGTSAEVDADTTGVDGPGPHLSADFACGKGAKKGKG